jgi:hypothetical protein
MDEEWVEVEAEQQPPQGPGMLRRAATSIGSLPVLKRVKKKKNSVKPPPPRE